MMDTQSISQIKPNPAGQANFFSKLTFWWTNELLKLGYKHNLETVDIYDVLPEDSSIKLANDLGREWEKELYKWKTGGQPSLLRALKRCYGYKITAIGFVFFLVEGLRICQAIFLGLIVSIFESDSTISHQSAFLYALGWTLSYILITLLDNFGFHKKYYYGMKMRVASTSLVYRKILKLSQNAIKETSSSTIVNILASDTHKFDQSCLGINYIWITPLEILTVVVLLWKYLQLGPYCFIGVAIILILSPVQFFIGRYLTNLRAEASQITDRRLKALNDVIRGIASIKINCWERAFSNMVNMLRRALISAIYFVSGKVVLLATFLTYVLMGNHITASILFTSMSLYEIIRTSTALLLPWGVQYFLEAKNAINRLQEFLLLGERSLLDGHSSLSKTEGMPNNQVLSMEDYTSSWSKNDSPAFLQDISLSLEKGQLVMLTGGRGSGKSSLLLSITGELQKVSGSLKMLGKFSYVPQEPWIFQGTIRDNILFGMDLDHHRYNKTLHACALVKELDSYDNGDITVLEEDGDPLTNVQKIKISIARAVYRKADLYLIDDVLSLLDEPSAAHIFNRCICGLLSKKTVLLVTHSQSLLATADLVVHMDQGTISHKGSFKDLKNQGVCFRGANLDPDVINAQPPAEHPVKDKVMEKIKNRMSQDSSSDESYDQLWAETASVFSDDTKTMSDKNDHLHGWSVYWEYFKLGGGTFGMAVMVLLCILVQLSYVLSDWWLYWWSHKYIGSSHNSSILLNETIPPFANQTSNEISDRLFWHIRDFSSDDNVRLCVYLGLFVIFIASSFLRASTFSLIAVRASRKLHLKVFRSLLRAPLSFFESQKIGDLMKCLSQDMAFIDDSLPATLFDCIQFFSLVLGTALIAMVATFWMLFVVLPLIGIFIYARHYYIKTAKQIKQLEVSARVPVYQHVSSTLSGLWTIRAFLGEDQYLRNFDAHQDRHTAAGYLQLAAVRWFTLRLDALSIIFVVLLAFILVATRWSVDEGVVGLALVYGLNLMGLFQYSVRQSTELQAQVPGMQNVFALTKIKPEADPLAMNRPALNWPQYGIVTLEGVTVVDNSAKLLRNVWCCFRAEEKVGVLSTCEESKKALISCILRLSDNLGIVRIDGLDVADLGIYDLRSKLSVVMQNPQLIGSSIRRHLDPHKNHPDALLWRALEEVQMKEKVKAIPGELYADIQEWKDKFDVGERQLLSLARALLKNSKIVIYEEFKGLIDTRVQNILKHVLSTKFENCTVITMATNINTIIQSDRTMVIEEGRVREFDPPHVLLQNKNGLFYHLVHKLTSDQIRELEAAAKDKFENRPYEAPPLSYGAGIIPYGARSPTNFLPMFQSNRLTGVLCHFSSNRFSTNRY